MEIPGGGGLERPRAKLGCSDTEEQVERETEVVYFEVLPLRMMENKWGESTLTLDHRCRSAAREIMCLSNVKRKCPLPDWWSIRRMDR